MRYENMWFLTVTTNTVVACYLHLAVFQLEFSENKDRFLPSQSYGPPEPWLITPALERIYIWDLQGRQSRIGTFCFVDAETRDQRAGKTDVSGRWAKLEPSLLAGTLRFSAVGAPHLWCARHCAGLVWGREREGVAVPQDAVSWGPVVHRSPDPGPLLLLQLIQHKTNHFQVCNSMALVHLPCCATVTYVVSKYLSTPKGHPISSHSLSTVFCQHQSAFRVYGFTYSGHFTQIQSHNTWPVWVWLPLPRIAFSRLHPVFLSTPHPLLSFLGTTPWFYFGQPPILALT